MQETAYASYSKLYDMTWSLGANVGGLLILYGILLALNVGFLYLLRYKHAARG